MIRRGIKALFYSVLFIFFVLWFMPKVSLWYSLEHALKPMNITFDKEQAQNRLLSLRIDDANVYASNLQAAHITHLNVLMGLLYNRLHLSDVTLGQDIKLLENLTISKASIVHHVFDPLNAHIHAQGSFGSLEGTFNITARKIVLHIKPSALLLKNRMLIKQLQKTKEGYTYALTF